MRQNKKQPSATDGKPASSSTQSLDRALGLLALVAERPVEGVSLGDVVESSGLAKPTAHRLLTGLKHAGLVDYHPDRRRFYPAFRLFQLGQSAGRRFDIVHRARPFLRALADETQDTVYLTIPLGDRLLCVAREQGEFPIKILTLAEGDERPLGLGSNGIVQLAAASDEECERLISAHRAELATYPKFSEPLLRQYVADARNHGYAFSRGFMMPEMSAIAMGVRGHAGELLASVSVAALTSRFEGVRFEFVLRALRHKVAELQERLKSDRPAIHQQNLSE